MQKTIFDDLYRQVQQTGISCFDTPQLIALSRFYNSIRAMVSVMPCLEQDYGSRQEIAKRAKEVAQILVVKIKEGMPCAAEMQCLSTLFEYANRHMDREWEGLLLERARLLLREYVPVPAQETVFCRLMCTCYDMVQKRELDTRAKKMIAGWCRQQNAAGGWPALKPETALGRLRAMEAYHTCTLRSDFENFQQKGTSYYLQGFPEHDNPLTVEELPLFLEKAGLLLLVSSHTAERKRIEKTGAVLEQYLQQNSPHVRTDSTCAVKGNRQPPRATDFPETLLRSLSILALCLLAQEECVPVPGKHILFAEFAACRRRKNVSPEKDISKITADFFSQAR